ncbi:HesA/MoeB/ThiF family protein [Aestuariivirga sp.]|uniref:HesA/MoeB/ThiF family protein n=1 Tax=Aestuariivirga sp. TaxID=2650926 RepID=UPI0039E2BF00
MTKKVNVSITESDYGSLMRHLFSGDQDEHGAILKAQLVETEGFSRLLVREIIPAIDGIDYIEGEIGHRALSPKFIHKHIIECRNERLVYVAVHNHYSDEHVNFSKVDFDSHERGYPALLDIAKGVPVGALVLGKRSAEADIWFPDGSRATLNELRVIGSTISRRWPSPPDLLETTSQFDRQIRMFGDIGQSILKMSRIGIVGLGGIGSLIAEYTSRLGVGRFVLVDPDRVEDTNLSRVVGAYQEDVQKNLLKIEIAGRQIRQFNPTADVKLVGMDVALGEAAEALLACDYIFLAADSMRARLVVNAIVHQYLIPAVQVGAKIRMNKLGVVEDAMSAIRTLRPGITCLWCNQLIDPSQLAIESKTDDERAAQAYGTHQPNPSVITMNSVAAAHSTNDFLFDFLDLRTEDERNSFQHFHYTLRKFSNVTPRIDLHCSECSRPSGRFAKGSAMPLPVLEE